jgi:hypothetical protein
MFDRIRSLLRRIEEVREVDALTERDLDDLGMSRAQVYEFLRMPRDIADRVMAMGAIFGVPEADLKRDHGQWVDLLTVCGHCADRGACDKVLARAAEADPARVDFCGNRDVLSTLAPHTA